MCSCTTLCEPETDLYCGLYVIQSKLKQQLKTSNNLYDHWNGKAPLQQCGEEWVAIVV